MFRKSFSEIRKAVADRPPINEEPSYKEAEQFKIGFQPCLNGNVSGDPKKEIDYAWIEPYSHFLYDQLIAANETLDAKADSFIRVFAGGSGLLTVGVTLQISKVSTQVVVAWAIALSLALVAVYFAMRARRPRVSLLPPTVKEAVDYAESYGKEDDQTRFLGQWHLCCEGIKLSNARKATAVTLAMQFGFLSIFVLALSFGMAAGTMGQLPNGDNDSRIEESAMSDKPEEARSPDPATKPAAAPAASDPAASVGPQKIQAGGARGNDAARPIIQESEQQQ